MKSRHLFLAVVLLVALTHCKPGASGDGDLRGSLPASDIQGYAYTKSEDANITAESVVNPAVMSLTPLPKGTTNVVIGYKRIVDRKTNASHTYKNEARIAGNDVTLVVTDTASNQEVLNIKFPEAQPHAGETQFSTLGECLADFFCRNGSQLQCDANRTCRDQFWAIICCLKSGLCVSVHGVVHPNTIRCQIISNVIDFNGLVLTRQ
jgi:hypothetical protein